MTYQEILEQARACSGPYCKACPVCNGMACKNTVPGPGAKGIGTGAIRNYQKWQELCVNMDTICENTPVDTTAELFGRTFALPVFAAPVGAMTLHYGDKYDDLAYNEILVPACASAGIAAFTGDGVNPAVMEGAAQALRKSGGCGVPTIKPWNLEVIRKKLALVSAAAPFAVAMDIDAAGLPFLKNQTPPAGRKTVAELREVAELAGKPFILKGIMEWKCFTSALTRTINRSFTRKSPPLPIFRNYRNCGRRVVGILRHSYSHSLHLLHLNWHAKVSKGSLICLFHVG